MRWDNLHLFDRCLFIKIENPFHKPTTVFIMSLCGSATFLFVITDFFYLDLTDLASVNRGRQGQFSQPFKEENIMPLCCPHWTVWTRRLITQTAQEEINITHVSGAIDKRTFLMGNYCKHVRFNLIDSKGDGTLMLEKLCPPKRLWPVLIMAELNI